MSDITIGTSMSTTPPLPPQAPHGEQGDIGVDAAHSEQWDVSAAPPHNEQGDGALAAAPGEQGNVSAPPPHSEQGDLAATLWALQVRSAAATAERAGCGASGGDPGAPGMEWMRDRVMSAPGRAVGALANGSGESALNVLG